jgi:Carboxypeptidase regulatory-like domain/TonB dependent receptor-like, beta-barrel
MDGSQRITESIEEISCGSVRGFFAALVKAVWLLALLAPANAQSTATLEGRVVDPPGAVVAGALVTVHHQETGLERVAETDGEGNYQVAALPVGIYRVKIQASGFQTQIVENLIVEVGRSVVQDFQLQVGDILQEVIVNSTGNLVERASVSVGHVIDKQMVQEVPLNGRYFLDIGLLVPGSVTPPQGAFSASPMRGLGSLAINTGGNREETVNYMINGITLNNLTFSSISFQPSISTVQEFKVDNSTFSAEYGQSSGAIVNIATRSGGNEFHGELFEFFRNDALDARNFFEHTSSNPAPFKRNQFGGNLGGPIIKKKTFFFGSYEGLRQRQGLDVNSLVLSDAQRASTTDAVIAKLIELIPRANFADQSGTPRFLGSASAPVDINQWTLDISHSLSEKDQLHGYYAIQQGETREPTRSGNTIPGFGYVAPLVRQIFTLNETHTFGPAVVNDARFGFNRWATRTTPSAQLNPADFGIHNGISQPIGLPQISIAGGSLNFGGPAINPSGRSDTTFVAADTLTWLTGRHSLKLGGEYRQFLNNNFRQGTGSLNFPTVAAFLAGTANSFSVTLGSQSSSIAQGALGFFVQDNYKVRPNLTLELGLRYEWNITPSERYDRFIVFDPQSASLLRVGTDINEIYHQNNKNFQPRLGFAWDPFRDGKTVVRGAYAILVDQPMTSVVMPTSANPPLAIPLTFTGTIRLDNAINLASASGLAPQTVDQDFDNAYMQSWNLNVQRELTPDLAVMIGYFGSKGTHLIIRRNVNQPVNGVRPFPTLSESSPILPGTPLGNITQAESTGNSYYNAAWLTAHQRVRSGLQFNASYTWSKSLDYNSFSSGGIVGQNSYDLRGDRGLSDFDARHRFVLSAIYELPFRGNQLVEGWQFAAIVQVQSGNPVNIVTSNSTVNSVANTLRPDLTGPIEIIGEVERWFDTSVFSPVARFGSLGRNVVIGPGFNNTDFSVIKDTELGERLRAQFRAELFDVFNHANFGRPGNVVGTPAFGRITSTRFPTGESGSSRQVQLALKLIF